MHSETERIFATLQELVEPYLTVDLPDHEDGTIVPFVWDASEQGEFNIINLCFSNAWLQLTDVDKRIRSWQKMEYAKSFYDFYLGAEAWNEKIANERLGYYQQLQQLVKNHLQNIQAYNLSVPKAAHQYFEWEHPYFSVSIVVAETSVLVTPTKLDKPQQEIGLGCDRKANLTTILRKNCKNLMSKKPMLG